MFRDSSPFVQELIRKMINPNRNNNMAGKYKDAFGAKEKQFFVHSALGVIIDDSRETSVFDAINVLKFASNEIISKQLFEKLT